MSTSCEMFAMAVVDLSSGLLPARKRMMRDDSATLPSLRKAAPVWPVVCSARRHSPSRTSICSPMALVL